MRIERIAFQAFGPYVNKVELAMEELSMHRLFLIKGATGAGKTVILDAITFALYGKSSSGERGDFETMRSRMADDKQKTFVELIFQVHGHRYRFYREIVVGKKRSGEARYKVNVNGGELIEDQFYPFFENCKMTLLEKQAEELIGLNHAQFIRTMILPQGKFERLLISNSEEKQEILKSLFQSERWAILCEALSDHLKSAKEKTERMKAEIESSLAQAEVKSLSECRELNMELKQQLKTLKSACEQAKKDMEAKQAHYEEQQQLTALGVKKAAYEKKKEELLKQEVQMSVIAQQIETAGEYEKIYPYMKSYHECRKNKEQAALQLTKGEKELKALEQQFQELELQKEVVKQKEQHCVVLSRQCLAWEQQLTLCEERSGKAEEMKQLEKQKQEAQAKLEHYQKALDGIKQQYDLAKKRIRVLEEATHNHPQLLVEAQRLEAKKQAEQEIEALLKQQKQWETESHQRTQQLTILRKQEQETKIQHELLYQGYLHDSAGLLASMLQEGSACPICGSTHHPSPAKASEQLTELAKLKDCKALWDQQLQQIQETDNWLKQAAVHTEQANKMITAKKEALHTQYGALDSDYEAQLMKQLKASTQAFKELDEQKHMLRQCEERIPKGEKAYEEILHQTQALAQQLLLAEAQNKERYSTIENTDALALQKQLNNTKQEISDFEAAINTWNESYQKFQLKLNAQHVSVTHLKEVLTKAENEYIRAYQELLEKNHKQLDIEQPLTDPAQLDKQKAALQDYQKQLTELQAAIHELSDQMKDRTIEPLDSLKNGLEAAKALYDQTVNETAKKEYRLEQIEKIEKHITQLQREYEEALLINARQAEFVKAMRGDTSIGIERYVLGIMLSHITRSANALLKNVHDGRYQLYRSDDTSGKVRKYGLELSIYDNATASMRSASSLSGGEKFLVSLALSLALSAVVQARNSTVSMESMFIDEGFGSLDEASIADALKVLSSMTNSKTMIGIISHVELLKENIPYGIEVTKGKQESTCRMLL